MADETKVVVEEIKNCPACKKVLRRSRRFYRNGAYYCNNTCFRTVQTKLNQEKAAAAEEAAKAGASADAPADEGKG
jgi:hypothetical protein